MLTLAREKPTLSRNQTLGLGAIASALHAIALVTWQNAAQGWDLHLFTMLTTVTLGIVLVSLVVSSRFRIESLGLIVYPLAAISLIPSFIFSHPRAAPPQVWPIGLHIIFAISAFCLILLGAIVALMVSAQDRALKARQFDRFQRALPPLALGETLMFQLLGSGFVLLSLALLVGIVFVENLFAQHLVHKTALSILAWSVLAFLLWGRWKLGWRGRKAIRLTLIATVLLILSYFGSKFVLELLLQRGPLA